jgi:phage shock protein A
MFRSIKRLFIWLGLMAEKATETDAINQAVVERGIRDSKSKADKAHYANGQLAGQIALLKDQIKRQERQRDELQSLLQVAVAANDEANGAHYAEELATLEQDLKDNQSQADSLEQLYKQNTSIIAESLREIQRFQREFEAVKARVAIGRSLDNLATMMKSSITELQGMMGGEMATSMQQLRQSAAGGEGQMRATLDLAKEMGSGVARQQEARKMRGAALFQEYKKENGYGATGGRFKCSAAVSPARTTEDPRAMKDERSAGVMECWMDESQIVHSSVISLLHYCITPLPQQTTTQLLQFFL